MEMSRQEILDLIRFLQASLVVKNRKLTVKEVENILHKGCDE